MSVDPDLFFRSLGGDELVPPGGVDAFVGDVMSQVRVHDAEASLAPRHASARGSAGQSRRRSLPASPAPRSRIATNIARRRSRCIVVAQTRCLCRGRDRTATKSFVETYSSHDATIVEMPNDGSDTKVVMIFDDKLPADL